MNPETRRTLLILAAVVLAALAALLVRSTFHS
jgi:hypothetical protein